MPLTKEVHPGFRMSSEAQINEPISSLLLGCQYEMFLPP